MASPDSQHRKPFARELAALSDPDLDRYLEEHRGRSGVTYVSVQDPENLPESFIQRLRDRAEGNYAATSHAVDLDKVTARLLELPADYNARERSCLHRPSDGNTHTQSPTSSYATQSPEPLETMETRYYNELVNDGGRPLFPIHLLGEVAGDPGAHREMLRPWQENLNATPPKWNVFSAQMGSWREFREWQIFNRMDGTPQYTEAAKRLLARYDFTRQFQFHDDQRQQDKLTTWIEYLAFICSTHYKWNRGAKGWQSKIDKSWETLADSGVLRPLETKESLCTAELGSMRMDEELRAYRAVHLAEEALAWAQKGGKNARCLTGNGKAADTGTRVAQSRLEEAHKSLESLLRRHELIISFLYPVNQCEENKKRIERWKCRLEWVLEQIPLVEAEMKEATVSTTTHTSKRGTKRRHNQEGVDIQNRSIKKWRGNTDNKPTSRLRNSHDIDASQNSNLRGTEGGLAGDRTDKINTTDSVRCAVSKNEVGRMVTRPSNSSLARSKDTKRVHKPATASPPLRRSARIAARLRLQAEKASMDSKINA
ncbi:hypothetical protein F5Y10DRAFT_37375 [Nemania abortiva]|nr:hypothetical protein F5Y10DRAFT_37375 [Nemania abortiva]